MVDWLNQLFMQEVTRPFWVIVLGQVFVALGGFLAYYYDENMRKFYAKHGNIAAMVLFGAFFLMNSLIGAAGDVISIAVNSFFTGAIVVLLGTWVYKLVKR